MPASLRDLESFGQVSAEDDAVLEYFLETRELDEIQRGDKLLVLGRKGSGKTAIVRYFTEAPSAERVSRPLNLRGYPWNVHASRRDAGAGEMEAYVASWRYLIAVELASLVLTEVRSEHTEQGTALRTFLTANYGGIEPDLTNIIRPAKIKLAKASLEPAVLGNKLFAVSFERTDGGINFGMEINALTDALHDEIARVAGVNEFPPLFLHFDELDRGLADLDAERAQMLIGLVLAARETTLDFAKRSVTVRPIVYLRSDLWRLLRFSDKNKISQASAIELEWGVDKLKILISLRITRLLDTETEWDKVEDGELMRGSQSKWSHVTSRTFLRPRDVIAFLNAALKIAKKREDEPLQFINRDITDAREEYSAYLKQELDDELAAHLPEWEDVVQTFAAISTITFDRESFEDEYDARASSGSVPAEDALHTLFDFSVIAYERRSGYGGSAWVFQYTHPGSQWDGTATRFKVHPGLKEFVQLKEERAT